MIKLTEKLSRLFFQEVGMNVGVYTDEGACIGDDCEFVIVYKKDGDYLAHISELEQEGLFVRIKEEIKQDGA